MLEALWLSFAVIFVAELGDKSQLLALAFATRYHAWPVLAGITISTGIVHALSVGAGALIAEELPTTAINAIAGIAFLGFAAWTLRGDRLGEADAERARKAFFIAELGDKTMLATITLASRYDVFGTWLGSTLGMVFADAIAIVVGRHLGKRLPERTVRIGAASLFVIFGGMLIFEAIRG
jgi:putative Ca2+/H+ antiporter (TMEM165/GDT1 family)